MADQERQPPSQNLQEVWNQALAPNRCINNSMCFRVPNPIRKFNLKRTQREREDPILRSPGRTELTGGVMPNAFQVTITEERLGDIRHGPPMTLAEAMQSAHHLKILFPTQRIFIMNSSKEIVYDLK